MVWVGVHFVELVAVGCMAEEVHFRVYGRWGSFQGVWQMEFISGCIADGVHFRVYGRWGSFRNAVT